MMMMLTMPAASIFATSGDASSRARSDSVRVSFEANNTMLAVCPAASTKLRTLLSSIGGGKVGMAMSTYVRSHPAPETRPASSRSFPNSTNTPLNMLVPVVFPDMTTTRINAQMVPYNHLSPGVSRKSNKRPSPDRMPGIAADDQMIESKSVRPRQRVRTNIYAKIEKRMGLNRAVLVAKMNVVRSALKKSGSLSTNCQWDNVHNGVVLKKPERVMKLPITRTTNGTAVSNNNMSTIPQNTGQRHRPSSTTPGLNDDDTVTYWRRWTTHRWKGMMN